jgi:hypothetical protein
MRLLIAANICVKLSFMVLRLWSLIVFRLLPLFTPKLSSFFRNDLPGPAY